MIKCKRKRVLFGILLFFCLFSYLILSSLLNDVQYKRIKKIRREINKLISKFKYDIQDKWRIYNSDFTRPCTLPQLKPFDPSVKEYFKKPKKIICENPQYPLLFSPDLGSNESVIVQLKDPGKHNFTNCCYTPFHHEEGTKEGIILSKHCIPITEKKTRIDSSIEFVRIECRNSSKKTVIVDMLGFIPKIQIKKEKSENNPPSSTLPFESKTEKKRKPNVVILGLDSMSYMNFQRIMPLTHKYLIENLSAICMDGYTKVGENTFPALIPALTGKSVPELKSLCWTPPGPFDPCQDNFIWKKYSDASYLTGFGEDAPDISMFHWQKGGFLKPPTHLYLHPLTTQLDLHLGHHKQSMSKACYGPRLTFQVLLNFLRLTASTSYKNNQNYFQLILATSLFHDGLNLGGQTDPLLLEALQFLQNSNYLTNTVFILMSDHGQRGGDIRRKTVQGRLEDSMPLMYFVLPTWFHSEFERAIQNLEGNRNKLVTTFDLHETLLDLLNLEGITDGRVYERQMALQNRMGSGGKIQNFQTLQGFGYNLDGGAGGSENLWASSPNLNSPLIPRGISLFLPVPKKRTCADAGIEDNFCVCSEMVEIKPENNTLVERGVQTVVEYMNGLLEDFSNCAPLTVENVSSAQIVKLQDRNGVDLSIQKFVSRMEKADWKMGKEDVEVLTLFLGFSVLPSGGSFECTVKKENGGWIVGGEIIRTNLYGSQSYCVNDYVLKKFCYCLS